MEWTLCDFDLNLFFQHSVVCVLIETKNPEVSVINLILFIIIIYIVISSTLINILSGLLKLRYKLRDVIFLSYVGMVFQVCAARYERADCT